jgi:glycosyltransferase involved in cell wall biosynthesis
MVGPDDGAMSEVRRIVRESALNDRVIFTGGLVGDDLRSAYIDADIFAFPSRFDIFPMTILEACAAAKPMVVSNTCPLSAWLAGCAALSVPPEPTAFASALDRLLANSDERARLSEGAKSLVASKFSVTVVAEKLESLYRDIVSTAQR